MSVTVVIVNWNGGDLLLDCLNHLNQQSLPADKVLLMDNGSSDGSAEKAVSVSGVSVCFLEKNVGFSKANNLAIEKCKTDWVALLNPDAIPDKDWLLNLITASKKEPNISVFGSQQRLLRTPSILDGVGDSYHISGLAWRSGHGKPHDEYVAKKEIFSPCACAAMYKLSALEQVGGFDEDFFCYMEDVDLGFRLQLYGYEARYISDAIVYHAGSASTGRDSDFSIYHGHRNLVWVFIKNMPTILFWAFLILHILLNIISIIYFSYSGKSSIILQSKKDAIIGITKMWIKRRKIQSNRKVSFFKILQLLKFRTL